MNYFLMPQSVSRQTADSLREAIATGRTTFEAAARAFSSDPVVAAYGGHMGWSSLGLMPRDMEEMIVVISPGDLSEVLSTSQGYMIVKGGQKRPLGSSIDAGVIALAHDGSEAGRGRAYALADSLAGVLRQKPQALSGLASMYSSDPVSRQDGGRIGTLRAGEALPEIFETLRALPDGGVSDPVPLQRNYLVIIRLGSKPAASFAQLEADEENRIRNAIDRRYQLAADYRRDSLRKLLASRYTPAYDEVMARMKSHGLDSTLMERYGDVVIINTAAGSATLRDLAPRLEKARSKVGAMSEQILGNEISAGERRFLESTAPGYIIGMKPELKALLKEYEEGTLMYEINNARVWKRAKKSSEDLERFFAEHRDDYRWESPRTAAMILRVSDRRLLQALTDTALLLGVEALEAAISRSYRGKAAVESVLVKRGENAAVDALLDGRVPTPSGTLPFSALLYSREVPQPEDAGQAGPELLRDYQNYLEEVWQRELDKLYPVEILQLP